MRVGKYLVPVFMVTLFSMLVPNKALALSPPWFLLQSKMKATVGNDPCVFVSDLSEVSASPQVYKLNVYVCQEAKALALADFIDATHDFGGVTVNVRVFDFDGNLMTPSPIPTNPVATTVLLEKALSSNRFFVGINPGRFDSPLYVEFKPQIVQYFADNISDYYQNNNEIAAFAFRDILRLENVKDILIGVTTKPL